MPADALRAYGAAIRAPLSWDRTIEETAAELLGDRFANGLALVRRVVVVFGTDGAASFTRLPTLGVACRRTYRNACSLKPASTILSVWKDVGRRNAPASLSTRRGSSPRHWSGTNWNRNPTLYILPWDEDWQRPGNPTTAAPAPWPRVAPILPRRMSRDLLHPKSGEPGATYFTAFPHHILDDPKLRAKPPTQSGLAGRFHRSGPRLRGFNRHRHRSSWSRRCTEACSQGQFRQVLHGGPRRD